MLRECVGAEKPISPFDMPKLLEAARSPVLRKADIVFSTTSYQARSSPSQQCSRDTGSSLDPVSSNFDLLSPLQDSVISGATTLSLASSPSCLQIASSQKQIVFRQKDDSSTLQSAAVPLMPANDENDLDLLRQTYLERCKKFEEVQEQGKQMRLASDRRFEELLQNTMKSAGLGVAQTKSPPGKIDKSQNSKPMQSSITGCCVEYFDMLDDNEIENSQLNSDIQLLYDCDWQFDNCSFARSNACSSSTFREDDRDSAFSSSGAVFSDSAFHDYCISVKNTFLHFDSALGGFSSARPRSCPVLLGFGADDTDAWSEFALSLEHGDVHAKGILYSKEHGDVHAFEGQALIVGGTPQVLSELAFSSEHGDVHAEDLHSKEHGDVHAFGGQALTVVDDNIKTQATKSRRKRKHKRKRDYAWKRGESSAVSK